MIKNPADGRYSQCSAIYAFTGYRFSCGKSATKNHTIEKNTNLCDSLFLTAKIIKAVVMARPAIAPMSKKLNNLLPYSMCRFRGSINNFT